jgi:hypothetical protein
MTSGYIQMVDDRKRVDYRVLKVLAILLVIALSASFVIQPFREDIGFTIWLRDLFSGLVLVFLLMGFILFRYYSLRGLVSMRSVLVFFLFASLGFAAFILLNPFTESVEFLIGDFAIDIEYREFTIFLQDIAVLSGFALAVLLILFIIGFGVIGVIASIQRTIVPLIFEHIERLRLDGTDSRWDKLMVWAFNIPYVMDTSKVAIDTDAKRKEFPRDELKSALIWEMLFSALVAVYISLNPIFLDETTPSQLLGIASSASVFIPFLILPWFIYRALDARIVGERRDFDLYRGIRNTFVGAVVAISTAIIFIKIGLEEAAGENLIDLFIGYFLFNLTIALLFSFIYFNYFENDLIDDITSRFVQSRGE